MLLQFLRKVQTNARNLSFKEIDELINKHTSDLNQVLDSGFKETPPFNTPMLKYWIGEGKIGDTPLEGEQKLFNSIKDYLFKYYDQRDVKDVVDELNKEASHNPNDVYLNEKYYEIMQLFTAFGHTSAGNMQKERLKKLQKYADPKSFRVNMRTLYDAVTFVANESRSNVWIIDKIDKNFENPFAAKGERNVGTPFWKKTNIKRDNTTIENLVYSLANKLWKDYRLSLSYAKYVNIPATMFGRNSTKGVEILYKNGEYIIQKFKASPRVIYGIPLITNSQLARLYYSVLIGMKEKHVFSTLKGTEYLRELLPKLAKFDSQNKVYRKSSDKSAYDTTLSAELMVCAAIIDILAFGINSKAIEIVLLSLVIDVLTPIYYKEYKGGPIKKLETFGSHKSGFYNTFRWGSLIGYLIYVYTSFTIDKTWFLLTHRQYASNNLPTAMFAGDDWSTIYKNKLDAEKAEKIEQEAFGLVSNTSKSAFGTWIVQNGCNSKGTVSYPLARALRSFYYPEKTSAVKPPFVLLMTAYSNIELLWESPHRDYFIKEHLLKTDKYRGGLEYEGKQLDFGQFYSIFVKQARDYGENKIFDSNDPRYITLIDKAGIVKSEWLSKIWHLIKDLSI